MTSRTLIGSIVVAVLAFGAMAAAFAYEPPDPAGCPSLIALSERRHDVAAQMDEAGCQDTAIPVSHDPTARP